MQSRPSNDIAADRVTGAGAGRMTVMTHMVTGAARRDLMEAAIRVYRIRATNILALGAFRILGRNN